jgi:hypothetical protein
MNFMPSIFSSLNIKLIPVFFGLSLLCSCSEAPEKFDSTTLDYTHLRRQLTPDRKHYIYDYSREGAFVTSNEITGTRLMRINQPFNENGGIDVGGMILSWSSNDTLTIHKSDVHYEQPKDTAVIRIDYEHYDGLVIKRVFEQPYVGSEFAGQFKFDSLRIIGDKISFFGANDILFTEKSQKKTLTFQIGDIVVSGNRDTISKI